MARALTVSISSLIGLTGCSLVDAITHGIEYPSEAPVLNQGQRRNVLALSATSFVGADPFSFAAEISGDLVLRIRMTLLSGEAWVLAGTSWMFSSFANNRQDFEAEGSGLVALEQFQFFGDGEALVEYFEGDDAVTHTKRITWSAPSFDVR